jgi:trigger factor
MIKKLPKSQIEFEITVPWQEWEKYLDMAASEASEEIKISGFRPGKAPRSIIEQKIGKEPILIGAREKAVKKSYVEYAQTQKLEIIGSPKIEILDGQEGKDLRYKVVASILPEIKIQDNYKKGIKKINQEFSQKKPTVSGKELELELEKLAASRVKLVTVLREARKGDSVEVDFQVLVGGMPIENGTSKKHPLIIGRGVFIPGFEEQIIGMKEGEEKEFDLAFPQNYREKNLAGKPAHFKVKMGLVQDRQTPELNDDFARSLGEFADLEALKKSLQMNLEHENEHRLKDEKRAKHMEEIIQNSKGDLPEILVSQEVEKMLQEFEYQLVPMGTNLGQYLGQIKKNKEELKADWKPQAEKRVRGALALTEIAKILEIKAEAGEIEAEMNKTLQYYKDIKDIKKNIDMERLYNYSRGILENEKVFEYLDKL